jgi:hypothetical protein
VGQVSPLVVVGKGLRRKIISRIPPKLSNQRLCLRNGHLSRIRHVADPVTNDEPLKDHRGIEIAIDQILNALHNVYLLLSALDSNRTSRRQS